MIKINKDYDNIPDDLLSDYVQKKQSDGIWSLPDNVKTELEKIYANKCAYCETSAPITVDHYRPKSKYDWLLYEWSNLLYCCHKCNSKKSDRFPIEGERITKPQEKCIEWRADSQSLLSEKPQIINPEIDNPELHIGFNADGSVYGKSERGNETIKICGLNNDWLKMERKKIYDNFFEDFEDIAFETIRCITENNNKDFDIYYRIGFKPIYERLKKCCKKESEYSHFCKVLLENFNEFIINKLDENLRHKIKTIIGKNTVKII